MSGQDDSRDGAPAAMEDIPVCRPYVSESGDLVVPADCDPQYRWWAGSGMGLTEILIELKVSKTVWERYVSDPYPEELRRENYPLLGG